MSGSSMDTTLLNGLRFFTRETAILEGVSAACGAGNRTVSAMDGAVREDSVFDLASVTKLFTGLCAMKLKEEGLLDPGRPVFSYDSRFRFLKDTTVWDLMTFAVTVRTPVRLDGCTDRESAMEALFASTAAPHEDVRRIYSDIPAMILKYVLEAAAGMSFMDCARKLVLEPAGMSETWSAVPPERRKDCQCYDREHRIENGQQILREGWKPGVPHDPKAAVLQGDTVDLCGHAGLFSTRGDMVLPGSAGTENCRGGIPEGNGGQPDRTEAYERGLDTVPGNSVLCASPGSVLFGNTLLYGETGIRNRRFHGQPCFRGSGT